MYVLCVYNSVYDKAYIIRFIGQAYMHSIGAFE